MEVDPFRDGSLEGFQVIRVPLTSLTRKAVEGAGVGRKIATRWRMRHPALPEAIGVLRAIERPAFDVLLDEQILSARAREGPGDLAALLGSGDTWTVD